MTPNQLMGLVFALLLVAVLCLLVAQAMRRRSGLPEGDIAYEDTSGETSDVLYSATYGLSGKPDYLLETDEGVVPVEVKSSPAPRNGKPYPSHVMQLTVYFLLVEEELDEIPPYGLLRYQDCTMRIENTARLRKELLAVVAEMQALVEDGEAQRSHQLARRCAGCSVAYACDERLA